MADDEQDDEQETHTFVDRRRRSSGRRNRQQHQEEDEDSDFESQHGILKWFKRVPGPLQDVFHQRAIRIRQSSNTTTPERHRNNGNEDQSPRNSPAANSIGFSVKISTCFDQGPWVDMCRSRSIPVQPGQLYGGVKLSSLQCMLAHVLEEECDFWKISQLLVLIKSMQFVDEEIILVLHDPTGEMEGYLHRDLVEQIGSSLTVGAGLVLRDVSVFTPEELERKSYINICPWNLQRVVVEEAHRTRSLEIFNDAQELRFAELERQERERDAQEAAVNVELTLLTEANPSNLQPGPPTTPLEFHGARKPGHPAAAKASGKWQWTQLIQSKQSESQSQSQSQTVPSRKANISAQRPTASKRARVEDATTSCASEENRSVGSAVTTSETRQQQASRDRSANDNATITSWMNQAVPRRAANNTEPPHDSSTTRAGVAVPPAQLTPANPEPAAQKTNVLSDKALLSQITGMEELEADMEADDW